MRIFERLEATPNADNKDLSDETVEKESVEETKATAEGDLSATARDLASNGL